MTELRDHCVTAWEDISTILDRCAEQNPMMADPPSGDGMDLFSRGVAFITYNYGIDGVSIEIAKYARCLEQLFPERPGAGPLHFMGGNFFTEADTVLKPHWRRCLLPNFDGWDKWEGGIWFQKLFHEDMPEGSEESGRMAQEIWRQAVAFTDTLCDYIREHNIALLIPVNVNSNPGNLASGLAVVLASELTGIHVLNSNHDFYWEGGKPASGRGRDEAPGVRDHFFRNCNNPPFFSLFKRLYPWNGRGWLQVNINKRQSDCLVEQYGFDRTRVFEIGTSIDEAFFTVLSKEEKIERRRSMACILADGQSNISPVAVDTHLADLDAWMKQQAPVVCGAVEGLELDIATPSALYFLQPTRVIGRKRIERNWQLIEALLRYPPFRSEFENNPARTLTLHITGPVPIEHRADLEKVLEAYKTVIRNVPELSERLFMAFSVGHEDHAALSENGLERLYIEDIYKLADLVVFPSETEGRGLPLVESGAAGIPIVSSRYSPEEVFAAVVGEHLPEDQRIQYTLFPEGAIDNNTLGELTDLIFKPDRIAARAGHNRRAVRGRYGIEAMKKTFERFLLRPGEICRPG